MGSKIYISPVGTSLLGNFARDYGFKYSSRYRDLQEWVRLSPNDPRNIVDHGEVCRALKDRELLNDMVSYVDENKDKSCAEVNGIMSIMGLFGHEVKDIELFFLYTKTCNAMLVKSVLRDALSKMDFRKIQEIELTGISSAERFDEGLVEILDKVSSIIREGKNSGCRVYVNATPGFKAETTFIVLISLIYGADGVVYIHESFNKPVMIPAIPLTVKREEVEFLLRVFGKDNELDRGELINAIGQKDYQEYLDRGLITCSKGVVRLRPWLRMLVE